MNELDLDFPKLNKSGIYQEGISTKELDLDILCKKLNEKHYAFEGNCGNFALALARELTKHGFECSIVVCSSIDSEDLAEENNNPRAYEYFEADIYHVALFANNKLYDGDGEITEDNLKLIAEDEYGDSDPTIYYHQYTDANDDDFRFAFEWSTNFDVYPEYYQKLINKEFKTLIEKIVKLGNKWQVQSKKGRNLGTYDTKKEAEKRLRQVHYFEYGKKLTEANISYGEKVARINFWDSLKQDQIMIPNDYFKTGYSKWIDEKGLSDLFDPDTYAFKEKSTYGKIKDLTPADEDEKFCILALKKYWARQFTTQGAKLQSVIKAEQAAKWEAERPQREAEAAKRKAEQAAKEAEEHAEEVKRLTAAYNEGKEFILNTVKPAAEKAISSWISSNAKAYSDKIKTILEDAEAFADEWEPYTNKKRLPLVKEWLNECDVIGPADIQLVDEPRYRAIDKDLPNYLGLKISFPNGFFGKNLDKLKAEYIQVPHLGPFERTNDGLVFYPEWVRYDYENINFDKNDFFNLIVDSYSTEAINNRADEMVKGAEALANQQKSAVCSDEDKLKRKINDIIKKTKEAINAGTATADDVEDVINTLVAKTEESVNKVVAEYSNYRYDDGDSALLIHMIRADLISKVTELLDNIGAPWKLVEDGNIIMTCSPKSTKRAKEACIKDWLQNHKTAKIEFI